MKFFNVYFQEADHLAVGQSTSDELYFLPDRGPVIDWAPPHLELVGGSPPDYLASDLGLRLCSDKMRGILESCSSESDDLQWLPAEAALGGDVLKYWVLHFPEPVPALGARSIRQGDFVVKPVFRVASLLGHSVLTYPGGEGVALVVNQIVRDALERAECTGMECELAAVDASPEELA